MKRFIVLTLFTFLSHFSFSQPKIEFEENTHDFGTVIEGEKPSYKFIFKNTGDEPIVLTSVKPSCGCTTPSWTREPVLPGKKGEIAATYNSTGRVGAFYKNISVVSNISEDPIDLKIKGVVIKPSMTDYTPEELAASPVLELEKNSYYFGKVEINKPNKYTFKVTNKGKSPLVISKLEAGCHCVSYSVDKEEIKSGESGYIEINYSAKNIGENKDIVTIISNDIKSKPKSITLKANAVQSLASPSIMQNGSSGFGF